MITQDGGLSDIECPECSKSVSISLPRNAAIASIIADPQNNKHNNNAAALERPREYRNTCPGGHTISILYDW